MTEQDIEALEKVKNEASTSDCDACGGDMAYDPDSQMLVCKFCGNQETIDFTSDEVKEIDLDNLDTYEMDSDWDMAAKVVECKNCGGQTVAKAEDETAYCVFCGSQHMIEHEASDPGIKPQGLVPYGVTYKSARDYMGTWVKRRWLAPRDLKERFRGKHLKGVYMPYWTFDADVRANYSCRIGEFYYSGSGDNRKRHTKWKTYGGSHNSVFDDQLVLGIDSDEADLMKKIEPFKTGDGQVVDYKPDYLAGYLAKKHTIKPSPAWKIAKTEMANEIASEIKRSLPGDTYDSYRQSVTYSNETFKHILLPVYMSAYAYNAKVYNVLINGQTGEVQGSAPVSPVKVGGLILLGIVIGVVVMMISNS